MSCFCLNTFLWKLLIDFEMLSQIGSEALAGELEIVHNFHLWNISSVRDMEATAWTFSHHLMNNITMRFSYSSQENLLVKRIWNMKTNSLLRDHMNLSECWMNEMPSITTECLMLSNMKDIYWQITSSYHPDWSGEEKRDIIWSVVFASSLLNNRKVKQWTIKNEELCWFIKSEWDLDVRTEFKSVSILIFFCVNCIHPSCSIC